MNEQDFLTELRLSRQPKGQASGLPLAGLIRSIDPSRAKLSPEEVERIRQKLDPVVEPSAGRTYLKRQLPRYFSMLVVLVFLGLAALVAQGFWWDVLAYVFEEHGGAGVTNLKGSWLVGLSVWVTLIVCPVVVVLVSVLEYRERRAKTSRSSQMIQHAVDTGEVAGRIECAILLCIIIFILGVVSSNMIGGFGLLGY